MSTSRSAATGALTSARPSSARSPHPFVPQLQLNRQLNSVSQALTLGGSSEPKWSNKTVSQPRALPIFRKTQASKRNESSLFRESEAPSTAPSHSTNGRGQSLHTDPFSEMRPRYQPKIKRVITHPAAPEDTRLHFKKVPQAERKEAPNTLISTNGLTFARGKLTTAKKFEESDVLGTHSAAKPARVPNFQLNRRFFASPKGQPTRGLSQASVFAPPEEQPRRPHTRIAPRGESLKGVFIGDQPVAKSAKATRPPWHTNTPRVAGGGGGAGGKGYKSQAPWHTSTPREPSTRRVVICPSPFVHDRVPPPLPTPPASPSCSAASPMSASSPVAVPE